MSHDVSPLSDHDFAAWKWTTVKFDFGMAGMVLVEIIHIQKDSSALAMVVVVEGTHNKVPTFLLGIFCGDLPIKAILSNW